MKTFRDLKEGDDVILICGGQEFHIPLICKQEIRDDYNELFVRIPWFNSFWFCTNPDETSAINKLTSINATLYSCDEAVVKPKKRKKKDEQGTEQQEDNSGGPGE